MFESKILHCCQVWGSCLSFLSWLCFPTDTRKLKTNFFFFFLLFFFCWTGEKENINLQHSKGEDVTETVAWFSLADNEANFLMWFIFCYWILTAMGAIASVMRYLFSFVFAAANAKF